LTQRRGGSRFYSGQSEPVDADPQQAVSGSLADCVHLATDSLARDSTGSPQQRSSQVGGCGTSRFTYAVSGINMLRGYRYHTHYSPLSLLKIVPLTYVLYLCSQRCTSFSGTCPLSHIVSFPYHLFILTKFPGGKLVVPPHCTLPVHLNMYGIQEPVYV
jgi:hypothetical protein